MTVETVEDGQSTKYNLSTTTRNQPSFGGKRSKTNEQTSRPENKNTGVRRTLCEHVHASRVLQSGQDCVTDGVQQPMQQMLSWRHVLGVCVAAKLHPHTITAVCLNRKVPAASVRLQRHMCLQVCLCDTMHAWLRQAARTMTSAIAGSNFAQLLPATASRGADAALAIPRSLR